MTLCLSNDEPLNNRHRHQLNSLMMQNYYQSDQQTQLQEINMVDKWVSDTN